METLQIGCPYELIIEAVCGKGTRIATYQAESQIHNKLARDLLRGEWYQLNAEQIGALRHDMLAVG